MSVDFTKPVHGTIPQNLIEKIIRLRIYESRYWKEHCFALTGELLVDKAVRLQYFGGVCSENNKPTPFLCLVLKMLQLRPEMSIVLEFVRNEEYKYIRCLGAFYLRLVGSPIQIYTELEPLYKDYRKLRFQKKNGWELVHMDEWIDTLLHEDIACNIVMPRLAKRSLLVVDGLLPKQRQTALVIKDDDESSLSSDSVSSESESEADEVKEQPVGSASSVAAMEVEGQERELEKEASDAEERKRKRKKKKKKKDKKKEKKKKKKKRKVVVKGLKATPKLATGLETAAEIEEQKRKALESKAEAGGVDFWNEQRAKLGLKPLRES